MNMRVPMIVIAAFWICTFSACKRSANKANVRTLDSLMEVTENLLTEMNAMDRDPLHAIDSSYQMRKATLEMVMRDTLDKRSAIALGNYHGAMNKNMGYVNKNYEPLLKELNTTRKQLTDLKYDVEQGALDPAVEAGYISKESLVLSVVQQNTLTLLSTARSVIRDHARLAPTVDSILVRTDTLFNR